MCSVTQQVYFGGSDASTRAEGHRGQQRRHPFRPRLPPRGPTPGFAAACPQLMEKIIGQLDDMCSNPKVFQPRCALSSFSFKCISKQHKHFLRVQVETTFPPGNNSQPSCAARGGGICPAHFSSGHRLQIWQHRLR